MKKLLFLVQSSALLFVLIPTYAFAQSTASPRQPRIVYESVQYAQQMLNVDDRVALKNLYYGKNNFAESPLVLECYALNCSTLGLYAQSIDLAYAATHKAPKNPHIAATVAYVLGVNKGNNTALRIIDKCLKEYPLDVRSRAIKAEILFALGNEENVDRLLESARKLDPESYDIVSAQKVVCLKRMEREKALHVVNEFLMRHPRHLRALIARAELYRQLALFDKAIADVDTVRAIMPGHIYAVALKAELLKLSKKYTQAAIFYRQYLALAQNDSDKHLAKEGLASVLRTSGKPSGASAVRLGRSVDSLDAIERNAQRLDNLGKYDAAIKEINKLLDIHSDYSDWYRWRARLHQKLGNMPAALKDLRRASDLDGAL